MKIKTLIALFFSLMCLSYFTSCDSSSYDIEEVEIYEDTTKNTANTEIKQEIELPKPDIKEDTAITRISPPVNYIIQIGAFKFESNAKEYLEKARKVLPYELTYQFIDGLHKIRTGIYNNKDDALQDLEKIWNAGFRDSFITEADK